ncbi:C-type cytochrome precursor- periplasmic heme binding protein [Rhodopirellula maiorica SM1]|uniref:C-type cytochrome-periplasmic heme binding protein n=1 Tax=Rhodopirellula maiorica SM1 TaxID=1265738 RepID=M5RN45_9BACT|nr:C-type cytochrome precursor- periplasmic heme binding protein [Rhodopirellula maiorica SM1]
MGRSLRLKSLNVTALTASLAALVVGLLMVVTMQGSSPRPVSRLEAGMPRLASPSCAECHSGIVADFATAPHSNTLRRGNDPAMLSAFAGQSVEIDGRQFSFSVEQDELWFKSNDLDYRRRVDWVFGSGRHALTPVSLDAEGSTQLFVSSYADGQLRTTPGASAVNSSPLRLGNYQAAADTRRCFGCHVSRLPAENDFGRPQHCELEMDSDSPSDAAKGSASVTLPDNDCMIANLDCSRCHFGAAEHARSGGSLPLLQGWSKLTPLESINRCGECHRRADEMKSYEISVDQTHLVRFAPVGLAMSRCFQVANAAENAGRYPRMDCITCHDPHLPSRTEPEFFEAICRDCHTSPPQDSASQSHPITEVVTCSQQPADSACLSCHMPMTDFAPGLRFTDHWIR